MQLFSMKNSDSILQKKISIFSIPVMAIHGHCLTEQWDLHMNREAVVRQGLAYKLESGDTLTLKDRIDGHFTASMATIKVSYENREKLISEFNKYFEESAKNPSFQYKSVIIKGSNEKSNIDRPSEAF